MKKESIWRYVIILGVIGFFVGILPFFSTLFFDNPFEIIFALPIIPLALIFGNGGAYDAVSVANVDSDDYPEIVVPIQFGIKVLDYFGGVYNEF